MATMIPGALILLAWVLLTSVIWAPIVIYLTLHWKFIGKREEAARKEREAAYFQECMGKMRSRGSIL